MLGNRFLGTPVCATDPQIPGHTKAGGIASVGTRTDTRWKRAFIPLPSICSVFFTSKVRFLRCYRTRSLPGYKTFPGGYHKNSAWSREARHGKAASRSSISLRFPLPGQGSLTGKAELMRPAWSRFLERLTFTALGPLSHPP